MLQRLFKVLFALCLMLSVSVATFAGTIQTQAIAPTNATAPTPVAASEQEDWRPSSELLAQGAGAVAGLFVYSWYLAPQAAAAEGVASYFASRLVAASLAGAGAAAGTYLYDYWSDLPTDYAYFWHRGGFVAGLAAGIGIFGVIGYPIEGGATWAVWAANRALLLGAGMTGAWLTDRWYSQP